MTDAVLTLQESLRSELKEPLGPVFTETALLLNAAREPLVAVGDVVTAHLLEAGHTPAVAVVDEQTERSAVDDWVATAITEATEFDHSVTVTNPAATLSVPLLLALRAAIAATPESRSLVTVDGEEDLATLPVLCAAPRGSTVVYGQPGEGMVQATADTEAKATARELLARMDGDTERLWYLLGLDE